MNTQTVVDQMTSRLAQRRQLTRDRRTAYQALARAILSDGPAEQHPLSAVDGPWPFPMRDRSGFAA
jgi:hypothetical protein